MSEVKKIRIKGEKATLEEYRELWKWHRNQFLKLNVYEDDYSTDLLTKFDEVVDELIENKFNSIAKLEEELLIARGGLL